MVNSKFYVAVAYAKRGKLLKPEDYAELLTSKDMASLISKLQLPNKRGGVDESISWINEDLVEECSSLRHFSKLTMAYYNRFLIWNIKQAFSSKLAGEKYGDIAGRLYYLRGAPVGGEELLKKTIDSFTAAEAVALHAGTGYHPYLLEALGRVEPASSKSIFDFYLDKYFIASLKAAADRQSRELVDYEIDSYDAAVRLKGGLNLEERKRLYIESDIVERCEGEGTVRGVLGHLEKKYPIKFDMQGDIDLDRMLVAGSYILAGYQFLKFSRPVVMAYMKLKERQARNLIGILTGYKYGLRADEIRAALMLGDGTK